MKAKLIKSLRLNGKIVSPKDGSVILVELDDKEFARLEAIDKVAKPSSDDLKIGQLVGEAAAEEDTATLSPYEDKSAAQKGADAKATADKAAPTTAPESETTEVTITEIKGRSKQTEAKAKAAADKADDEL